MTRACLDIGNTRLKIGIFSAEEQIYEQVNAQLDMDLLFAIFKKYKVDKIIVSSTRAISKEIRKIFSLYKDTVFLDHHTPIPIKNSYQTPASLGMDRLASVTGAYSLDSASHNLVIDLGTCITFDFIKMGGDYIGGNIAPGMSMRLQAMHDYTDKLPKANAIFNSDPIGNGTLSALQNGVIWGIINEINGLTDILESQFGELNVILTGGDASFFADKLKKKIFAVPNLVLIGLNEILKYNAKHI